VKKSIASLILILFIQCCWISSVPAQEVTTPANALQHYLHNGDKTFHWALKDSFETEGVTGYDLLLTSQQWRQYTWRHQLTILSPKENKYDGALLFITGGHNEDGKPHWTGPDNQLTKRLGALAAKNKAIVAIIRQVPNEPLFDSLVEDQIISYTLHQFKKDTNYTWPLLFPMVKSTVRAMDAVQEFASGALRHPVTRFVVSGASKRGWTTWLTGASDPRVTAIGPMVIDILNMPVNLAHQMKAYGGYSVEIQDYVNLGIVQGIRSKSGKALVTMIDPYSYRGKLTMPKMLFMGTNDPYWVIDNVKNYLPAIPGDNLLHYVPNAGHDLGDGKSAFRALSAFFGITMAKGRYPVCTWKTKENKKDVRLTVDATKAILTGAVLWYADSRDEDFRNDKWYSKDLGIKNRSRIKVSERFPASGYRAFYLDLNYRDPNGGEYTVSTRAFMTDTGHIL
jgi:PhoPQ-activated pathogenicity-related protein